MRFLLSFLIACAVGTSAPLSAQNAQGRTGSFLWHQSTDIQTREPKSFSFMQEGRNREFFIAFFCSGGETNQLVISLISPLLKWTGDMAVGTRFDTAPVTASVMWDRYRIIDQLHAPAGVVTEFLAAASGARRVSVHVAVPDGGEIADTFDLSGFGGLIRRMECAAGAPDAAEGTPGSDAPAEQPHGVSLRNQE